MLCEPAGTGSRGDGIGMAEERDLIDEFIDIKSDWQALSNPLNDVTAALTAQPNEVKIWNPADYKERPRANTTTCTTCQGKDESICTLCKDVCPVKAIDMSDGAIEISDACRKCCLCATVCPNECFSTNKLTPRKIYERIVRAANAFEHAYVTCTRAIGRMPQGNEVVLPCVGAVPAEVWYAVMSEYPNVEVYLPLGICDRCRNTTGEDTLAEQIGKAEEMSGKGLGLEVSEKGLDYTKNHAFERKEFINSLTKQGIAAVGAANPALAVAKSITNVINQNTRRINSITHALEGAAAPTASRRRRVLIQRRQLLMTTLQKHPKLAVRLHPQHPVCDSEKCNLCGECSAVCPTRACEVSEDGVVTFEGAYCTECGACMKVCEAKALTFAPYDAKELVVPDKEEIERKKREAEQKAEIDKLKKQGLAQLDKGLAFLEKLDFGDDD